MESKRKKTMQDKKKLNEEKEKEKILKNALQQINNNLKKGECMKLMTVKIDENIITVKTFYQTLIQSLEESNLKYTTCCQSIPKSISWSREIQFVDENDGQPKVSSAIQNENELLIILEWNRVVDLITTNTFKTYLLEQKTLHADTRFTLALYGFQGYFKYWKNRKNQRIRQEITGSQKSSKKSIYDNSVKISPRNLEKELAELQILAKISYRTIESPEELSSMVVQYSKSIAEAPAKLEQQLKAEQVNSFIKSSNKDCVRVDKDGNGLKRVWQQQLMQFSMASLETVQAIVSQYPSLKSLMEAYSNCSPTEGEALLQNLTVRRAAGPIVFQKKIGIEMSKRIYTFFTTRDGNAMIHDSAN